MRSTSVLRARRAISWVADYAVGLSAWAECLSLLGRVERHAGEAHHAPLARRRRGCTRGRPLASQRIVNRSAPVPC